MGIRRFLRGASKAIRRVKGISTPIGGISWDATRKDERQIIHRMIEEFCGRRVIYHYHGDFEEENVANSVKRLRDSVTTALAELTPESQHTATLRQLRKALQGFQTYLEQNYPRVSGIPVKRGNLDATLDHYHKMKSTVMALLKQLADDADLPLDEDIRRDLRDWQ
jgi:hypothetical protein